MIDILLHITIALAILGVLIAPLLLLGNLIPTAALTTAVVAANSYIGIAYQVIPLALTAVFSFFGAVVVIEGTIGIYKLVRWVYRKIPGIT